MITNSTISGNTAQGSATQPGQVADVFAGDASLPMVTLPPASTPPPATSAPPGTVTAPKKKCKKKKRKKKKKR